LLLLDSKDLSVRQLYGDLFRPNIDRKALLQIETGFGDEIALQFHALRTAYQV